MDYQVIADRIELALTSLGATTEEELRELAEAYAQACQEVNQRLQDIHHLIKAGERSEAIRRADIPPRLLDAIEVLDLPDRDAWMDVCTLKGLPNPPELLTQYITELNEAYESERGLAGLLRQHRYLALAQAPLAKRAEILRQLAEAEPENPVWAEDLLALEKYWLDLLPQEIQEHLKNDNLQALEETLKQLESEKWRYTPPASLIAQCRSALETARARAFRRAMEQLADAIQSALASRDLARVEEYVRNWQQQAAANPQWVDWELQSRVQPALSLVKKLEAEREADRRRRQLFNQFQQLLAAPPSRREVEQQYLALKEAAVTIPPEVEERYQEVIREFRRRATLRRTLFLGIAGLVFVAVATVVWRVQAQIQENHRVAEAAAAVKKLIENYQFDEAEKYLGELQSREPRILRRPELVEVKVSLDQAREAENARRKKFDQAVELVQSSLESQPNGPALQQAEALARTQAEKELVKELREKAESRWSALRSQAEERLRQRIKQVADDFDQLLQRAALSVDEELRQLTQLVERLNRLETENREQGLSLERELSQLKYRIQGRFMEVSQTSEQEKRIRDLCAAAAAGPQAYLAMVRRLSNNPAGSGQFFDLSMVEAELPRLDELNSWNQAASLWNNRQTKLSDDVRSTLRNALTALQVEPTRAFPFTPEQLSRLETYLDLIAQREQIVITTLAALHQEWQQDLIRDAWMVRLNDNRRYYSLHQPLREIEAIRNVQGTVSDTFSLPPAMVAHKGRAPHSILLNRIQPVLANWVANNWESSADTILTEILGFSRKQGDELPEPPVLFHLFDETLNAASSGDVGWQSFRESMNEQLQKLRDQYPPTYDWVQAAYSLTADYADIRGFFESLPPPEEILKQVAGTREQYRGIPWRRLEWVGILLADNRRVWYVRPIRDTGLADGVELFVLEPPPGGKGLNLRRLGTWKGQRGVVEGGSSLRLYNGRPVVAFISEG